MVVRIKIKKGDNVLVLKGKDREKSGKVQKVLPRENKIIVEGLNLVKKHVRPKHEGEKGQVIQVARPISIANVKLICPKCGRPTRVGYSLGQDKKFRICKKCKNPID